uniref:Cadherin domain-containing protein n=1 Tax=Pundamilia nyererei TaxID=303518 RepID=A0A3B4GR40_9CICH
MNDNAPEIVLTSKPNPVREDAPKGTVVALISARDLDSGNNGKVSLELKSGPPFTLKPSFSDNYALVTSGVLDRERFSEYNIEITATDSVPELVLEKTLDREKQGIHQLLLTALDGGNPVKTGTSKITVTVLDNNDNVPVFKKPLYKITVPESSQSGLMLAKVEATDQDEGVNGEIEYSFADHTPEILRSIFQINSATGEIFLKGKLDYENFATHELDISGHCRVQVDITDFNDNAPEIVFTSQPKPLLDTRMWK